MPICARSRVRLAREARSPAPAPDPPCGSSSVASTRSSVVLPAPFGPSTASVSPRASSKVDVRQRLALAEAARRGRSTAIAVAGARPGAARRRRQRRGAASVAMRPCAALPVPDSSATRVRERRARSPRRPRAMLFGLPGKLTISVRPRMPATAAREHPVAACARGDAARIASAMPGASRSITARVASGVTSSGAKPVPPVVSTRSQRSASQ